MIGLMKMGWLFTIYLARRILPEDLVRESSARTMPIKPRNQKLSPASRQPSHGLFSNVWVYSDAAEKRNAANP